MKPSYYKRLFKKYGLTPERGRYLGHATIDGDERKCVACAIGLRFVHAMKSLKAVGNINDVSSYVMVAKLCEDGGMTREFARGLDNGWESIDGTHYLKGCNGEYDKGFIEGRAAAVAVFGE